jgi:hypothetical protein
MSIIYRIIFDYWIELSFWTVFVPVILVFALILVLSLRPLRTTALTAVGSGAFRRLLGEKTALSCC